MIAVSVKPCIVMCILPDAGAISTSAEFLCYVDSTIPLLLKSEISFFLHSSMIIHTGLCLTWSKTPKICFLTSPPILLLGDEVIQVFTRDNDSFTDPLGDNARVRYRLGGGSREHFQIEEDSGMIIVSRLGNRLDVDTFPTYDITVGYLFFV